MVFVGSILCAMLRVSWIVLQLFSEVQSVTWKFMSTSVDDITSPQYSLLW
jgi:hypothetical protein